MYYLGGHVTFAFSSSSLKAEINARTFAFLNQVVKISRPSVHRIVSPTEISFFLLVSSIERSLHISLIQADSNRIVVGNVSSICVSVKNHEIRAL